MRSIVQFLTSKQWKWENTVNLSGHPPQLSVKKSINSGGVTEIHSSGEIPLAKQHYIHQTLDSEDYFLQENEVKGKMEAAK